MQPGYRLPSGRHRSCRGIAAEDLPHIVDRFYKSGDSGGMGLGLAITRNLIAAHGGHIDAHSRPDKGTIIRFTLPVDR
jgi:signal transduction histidine kinase